MTIYPKQGDVIIIDAEPHSGSEYGGHDPSRGNIRRRMVVVSSTEYNKATHMIIGMPITTSNRYSNDERYKEILVMGNNCHTMVKGYVVLWQLLNYDFDSRQGEIVNNVSQTYLKDLMVYVKDILGV
ncbi:type II toxin-antitoxin system PemK/MazF family toxin [Lactobacillus taiwanensis]|uniref:type II toxin-antitoxin system PemK/MazF family toxin n=1 Tax=Lactobacillus taiwanensis TaxID=508451 RepID=UPI003220146E